MPADYEVIAIRYGDWQTTKSHCYFRYPSYAEPDADIRMDFFAWLIRNDDRAVLVDTGYSAEAITTRPGRSITTPVVDALRALGTEPESISDLIVSHLHYDHTGNLSAYPQARLHVQQRELDFWTSSYASHPPQVATSETVEIEYVRQAALDGRARLLDGTVEVAPGIHAELVGGHTPGQQIVTIEGERPIVLASDAVHYYEEMEKDRPFEIFSSLTAMYDTYAMLRDRQERDGAVIVAGHDPRVMERFSTVAESDAGPFAVRVG